MTSAPPNPPRMARALAHLLCPPDLRDEMEGDLLEGYREMVAQAGRRKASGWYWGQVLFMRPLALRASLRQKTARPDFQTSRVNRMSGKSFGFFDGTGDLRYAFRSFLRSPLHALMTVVILAVGIGAVTLMFSALNASVLRPLPYPDSEELVWVWKASDRVPQNSLSWDDYLDYREGVNAFEELGAYGVFSPRLLVSGSEGAERIRGQMFTAALFRTLGVEPVMGRTFAPEEEVDGGPRVIILSNGYWQGALGGDPGIIGTTLTLDGEPVEIIGVMPEGFEFRRAAQFWVPARAGEGYATGRGNNNFFMVGRLRDGVTIQQAQSQMDAVALQIQEANPDFAEWSHWLQPLHEAFFGNMRPVLLLLMGIVSLVPLVACANVASLTLARASTRSTELATRFALGAGRARVIRQLLVENLVLALLGGVAGLGLASVGGGILRSYGPASIPRLDEIGVDATVVLFAMGISLLLVPLFGILTALRGTGFNLAQTLRDGSSRGGSDGRGRARRSLVVAQVALSMMLLVTSGLFLRSFILMQRVSPGFETRSILTAGIQLPDYKYETPEELSLAWSQTLDRLEAVPGVVDVATADWLPIVSGGGPWNGLSRPDHPLPDNEPYVGATRKLVSTDYFSILDIPLLAGRSFTADDQVGTPDVMILSEPLAEALFPGEDPLGQVVTHWGLPFEVVGVSSDVAEAGLGVSLTRPAFFVAHAQYPQESMQLVVRVAGPDPVAATASVRAALLETDPDIALSGVQTMEAGISGTLAQNRFQTALVGAFALVGLLLAAFGLYGVLSYLVSQRQQEIGIRMAVGAQGRDVLGLVLRQGMQMVLAGSIIGLVGGGAASVVFRRLLVGISPADPVALVGSFVVLGTVAGIASFVPAMKAVRTDPLKALRAE